MLPSRPHSLIHHAIILGVLLILAISAIGAPLRGAVPHDPKWEGPFFVPPIDPFEQFVRVVECPLSESEVFASLIAFEGYRLVPYRDKKGMSVGVGHNLSIRHEKVRTYTDAEVMAFFRKDLAAALEVARGAVRDFDGLPQEVRLLVLHLVWTCGDKGFREWTELIACLNYRAWASAAASLADSEWYRKDVSAARASWAYHVLLRQSLILTQ